MVVTESQAYRKKSIDSETMSDSESDLSVPKVVPRDQMITVTH